MNKKKIVVTSLILILCAIGVTIAATLGYYTDHQVQSVVLRAANLDYTITATIDGSDEFNNYASSSDIKTVEFAITNNSENSTMAEIGLNANFMFDKPQDCNDLLFYPDTVSDSEIINEIQNNTFSKNYSVENKKVVFDKVTVNQNSSYRFKIKIANKTDINSGNVLQLITQAKVFTGNASGGTGFLSDMEDTTGLYYFYNSNNANNTVVQGIQTITSGTILYSTSTTYSLAQPLADLTGLGVIEENIDFFDYNGKLIDYGLTMSNGKIYGTPNNMPDSYEIRFRYNAENKSWVAKSSETDGSYIGKILLKFKKNNTNIADTTIANIPNQTYSGSEIKPDLNIAYEGYTLVKDTDYKVTFTNNVNVGTATATIEGIGKYEGTTTKSFVIEKAAPVVSAAPSSKSLTYNGEQQGLINAGTAKGGTVYYKLSSYTDNSSNKTDYNKSYTTTIPVGVDAGTYKIDYYIMGDSNHSDSSVTTIDVVIERASYTSTVSISDYTYGGTKSTPTVDNNPGEGSVTYYGRSTSNGASTNWSAVTSKTYDAGTRYIYASISATNNYNACTTSNASFTISKASFTASVSISGYVYGGTKSTPSVTNNPGNGAVTYYGRSASNGTATSWNDITSTTYDSGTRYIYATIAETTNYLGFTTNNTEFVISKANSSIATAPSAKSLTYTGSSQSLINAGTANNGTIYYRLQSYTNNSSNKTNYNNSYSTSIPVGTDAGTYIVQYYVSGNSNYNDTAASTVSITINRASFTSSVSISNYVYGGVKSTPSVTNNPGGGTVTYYGRATTSGSATNWNSVTSTTYEVGTRYIYAYISATNNYNSYTTANKAFSITVGASSLTAPVANTLTYNNASQTLTTTGSTSDGTIYYRLYSYTAPGASTTTYNYSYSTSRPTGTAAGVYVVQYYVKGDSNHSDSAVGSVSVTINARSITGPQIGSVADVTYNGNNQTPSVSIVDALNGSFQTLVNDTDYTLSYSNNKEPGTATITITGKGNYNSSTTKTFTINKASMADVTIGDISVYTYDTIPKRPTPTVTIGGTTLDRINDYTSTWTNNTNAGTATLTITAKSDRFVSGTTKSKNFTIQPLSIEDGYDEFKTYPHIFYGSLGASFDYTGDDRLDDLEPDIKYINEDAYEDDDGRWVDIYYDLIKGTDFDVDYYSSSECVNIGNYTVKITGKNNFTGTIYGWLDISAVDASVTTAPTANTLSYTGSAQTLTTAGTASGGTMYYRLYQYKSPTDSSYTTYSNSYSTTRPTGTNAGTYIVQYYVKGDGNHSDTSVSTVTITISKTNASVSTAPSANTLTYNGSAQTLTTAGTASGGTMYYRLYQYKSPTDSSYTTYSNSYSTTRPTSTNAGTYIVQYYVAGDANHNNSSTSTVTITISKATASFSTAPSANTLTYSGSSQTLTTTGFTSDGTIYYRLYQYKSTTASSYTTYSNSYTTTRPTGTNAGTYIVQYYVVGDSNHNNSSTGSVTVTISKASFTATVSISNYTYAGTKSTPSVSNNPGGGTVTYYGRSTSSGTATNWSSITNTTYNAGTRYVYATIAATANYNSYTTANKSFTINKASQSAPTSLTSSVSGTTVTLTASGSGKTSLQYSKDGSTWQSSNVFSDCSGTITFYARYASNTNYNASSSKTVSVTLRSGLWTDYAASSFAGGSGTSSDPYQIATGEQLARMAYLLNTSSSYSGVYYKLTANIDLSAHYWVPAGISDTYCFNGDFNGQGYSISGLIMDTTNNYEYCGLFGYVGGKSTSVEIYDFSLIEPKIDTNNDTVGSICGYIYKGAMSSSTNSRQAYIKNIYIYKPIVKGSNYVGGIVGQSDGYFTATSSFLEINDCYLREASIENSSGVYTGGVVGYNKGALNILNSNIYITSIVSSKYGVNGIFDGLTSGIITLSNASVSIENSNSSGFSGVGNGFGGSSGKILKLNNCVINQAKNTGTASSKGYVISNVTSSRYTISNCFYNTAKTSFTNITGNTTASGKVTGKSFTTANIKSIINTLGSSEWGTDGTNIYYKSSTLTDHMTLVTLNEVELLSEDVIDKVNEEGLEVDISTPESEEITEIPTPQPSVTDIPEQDTASPSPSDTSSPSVSPSPSTTEIPNISEYSEDKDNNSESSTPKPMDIPGESNKASNKEYSMDNSETEKSNKEIDEDIDSSINDSVEGISEALKQSKPDEIVVPVDVVTDTQDKTDVSIEVEQSSEISNSDKKETSETIKTSDADKDNIGSQKKKDSELKEIVDERIHDVIIPQYTIFDKDTESNTKSEPSDNKEKPSSEESVKEKVSDKDNSDTKSDHSQKSESNISETSITSEKQSAKSKDWSKSLTESSPILSDKKESVKGGDSDAEVD